MEGIMVVKMTLIRVGRFTAPSRRLTSPDSGFYSVLLGFAFYDVCSHFIISHFAVWIKESFSEISLSKENPSSRRKLCPWVNVNRVRSVGNRFHRSPRNSPKCIPVSRVSGVIGNLGSECRQS